MKCHYEVLEVAQNASDDDLKKAYRKLVLKWHPDKNLDSTEEAKEQFQIVQQAWEVLSDPHERAWYDNHREAILKRSIGEDYKDDSIDLFQYFVTTCFKGYGDDEKGFFAVYRKVFEKLTAEDAEFAKEGDSDEEVPEFGNSQSTYEDVVHNFYAYWQSYSTKRSFTWLDPYDVRNASNRRIARLMEKENKKVRDKAKRERNEQVRNLVAFVRKRDKRVQAYAAKLADRAKENLKKVEERKKQQLLERQKQLREHKESEWSKFSNIEAELKNIEANLVQQFGKDLSSERDIEDENTVNDNTLYCVACNKIFKTCKAFTNHENSKKHKNKIVTMKASMINDDKEFESSQDSDTSSQSTLDNERKLATDSQMPDFLLNPVQSSSYNESNMKDEISEELISDDEDSDNSGKVKGKKLDTEGTILAVDSQMGDAAYNPPEVTANNNECVTSEDELISDQDEEEVVQLKKQNKKKKRKKNVQNPLAEQASDEEDISINEDIFLSKKQRKKQQQKKAIINKVIENNQQMSSDGEEIEEQAEKETNETELHSDNLEINDAINEKLKSKKSKNTNKINRDIEKDSETKSKKGLQVTETPNLIHSCITCKAEFPSKNKLFEHLKKTGHSIYISNAIKNKKSQERLSKVKGKSDKKSHSLY
ncbi:dnaJ homolog subfamily C member 21 [Ptiloglossa arizonensis]|uniref:dnaJ homolog subfamily C member 21 n=1 Tax=Ptiloglossa arizonensis TaxID=3350558 RepID=UPI003FA052BE